MDLLARMTKTSTLDSLVKESDCAEKFPASEESFYGSLGDKVEFTAGENSGSKGTIVSRTSKSSSKTVLEDGYEVDRNRESTTYEVEKSDGEKVTVDESDGKLKNAEAAAYDLAKEKMALFSKEVEKRAMYCCIGDKVVVVSGEKEGKKGKVIGRTSNSESSEYFDGDEEVRKTKSTEKVTIDTDDGEVEVDSNDVDLDSDADGKGGGDKSAHVCKSLSAFKNSIYKVAVTRILNGDMALDDMINTFGISEEEYKSADSATQKAKKPANEEGYPKGESAGGPQEALRTPTSDTNISKEDGSIKEKQKEE